MVHNQFVDHQRHDLDLPVLMLEGGPRPGAVWGGVGRVDEGLAHVDVLYGDQGEELRLRTSARRGGRAWPDLARWTGDDLRESARDAVTSLLLSTVLPGTSGEESRRLLEEHGLRGRRLAEQLPGPPWQWRPVPVDGVDFAMWFATLPEGFVAVLDHGPVHLSAWGSDVEAWDWRLVTTFPEVEWPQQKIVPR